MNRMMSTSSPLPNSPSLKFANPSRSFQHVRSQNILLSFQESMPPSLPDLPREELIQTGKKILEQYRNKKLISSVSNINSKVYNNNNGNNNSNNSLCGEAVNSMEQKDLNVVHEKTSFVNSSINTLHDIQEEEPEHFSTYPEIRELLSHSELKTIPSTPTDKIETNLNLIHHDNNNPIHEIFELNIPHESIPDGQSITSNRALLDEMENTNSSNLKSPEIHQNVLEEDINHMVKSKSLTVDLISPISSTSNNFSDQPNFPDGPDENNTNNHKLYSLEGNDSYHHPSSPSVVDLKIHNQFNLDMAISLQADNAIENESFNQKKVNSEVEFIQNEKENPPQNDHSKDNLSKDSDENSMLHSSAYPFPIFDSLVKQKKIEGDIELNNPLISLLKRHGRTSFSSLSQHTFNLLLNDIHLLRTEFESLLQEHHQVKFEKDEINSLKNSMVLQRNEFAVTISTLKEEFASSKKKLEKIIHEKDEQIDIIKVSLERAEKEKNELSFQLAGWKEKFVTIKDTLYDEQIEIENIRKKLNQEKEDWIIQKQRLDEGNENWIKKQQEKLSSDLSLLLKRQEEHQNNLNYWQNERKLLSQEKSKLWEMKNDLETKEKYAVEEWERIKKDQDSLGLEKSLLQDLKLQLAQQRESLISLEQSLRLIAFEQERQRLQLQEDLKMLDEDKENIRICQKANIEMRELLQKDRQLLIDEQNQLFRERDSLKTREELFIQKCQDHEKIKKSQEQFISEEKENLELEKSNLVKERMSLMSAKHKLSEKEHELTRSASALNSKRNILLNEQLIFDLAKESFEAAKSNMEALIIDQIKEYIANLKTILDDRELSLTLVKEEIQRQLKQLEIEKIKINQQNFTYVNNKETVKCSSSSPQKIKNGGMNGIKSHLNDIEIEKVSLDSCQINFHSDESEVVSNGHTLPKDFPLYKILEDLNGYNFPKLSATNLLMEAHAESADLANNPISYNIQSSDLNGTNFLLKTRKYYSGDKLSGTIHNNDDLTVQLQRDISELKFILSQVQQKLKITSKEREFERNSVRELIIQMVHSFISSLPSMQSANYQSDDCGLLFDSHGLLSREVVSNGVQLTQMNLPAFPIHTAAELKYMDSLDDSENCTHLSAKNSIDNEDQAKGNINRFHILKSAKYLIGLISAPNNMIELKNLFMRKEIIMERLIGLVFLCEAYQKKKESDVSSLNSQRHQSVSIETSQSIAKNNGFTETQKLDLDQQIRNEHSVQSLDSQGFIEKYLHAPVEQNLSKFETFPFGTNGNVDSSELYINHGSGGNYKQFNNTESHEMLHEAQFKECKDAKLEKFLEEINQTEITIKWINKVHADYKVTDQEGTSNSVKKDEELSCTDTVFLKSSVPSRIVNMKHILAYIRTVLYKLKTVCSVQDEQMSEWKIILNDVFIICSILIASLFYSQPELSAAVDDVLPRKESGILNTLNSVYSTTTKIATEKGVELKNFLLEQIRSYTNKKASLLLDRYAALKAIIESVNCQMKYLNNYLCDSRPLLEYRFPNNTNRYNQISQDVEDDFKLKKIFWETEKNELSQFVEERSLNNLEGNQLQLMMEKYEAMIRRIFVKSKYWKSRCKREIGYRSDLIYQKKYLLLVVSSLQASEESTLSLLYKLMESCKRLKQSSPGINAEKTIDEDSSFIIKNLVENVKLNWLVRCTDNSQEFPTLKEVKSDIANNDMAAGKMYNKEEEVRIVNKTWKKVLSVILSLCRMKILTDRTKLLMNAVYEAPSSTLMPFIDTVTRTSSVSVAIPVG